MGMIRIEMSGSFYEESFETSAEEGGHVAALRRAITFLTKRLTGAVIKDSTLARGGKYPHWAPLGHDRPPKP